MREYRFSTVWCIEAPVHDVWDAIHDSARWPEWWKSVERVVELDSGDGDGLGAVVRYIWKGVLPYRVVLDMRITRIEPLKTLEGVASGMVEGIGRWHFSGIGQEVERSHGPTFCPSSSGENRFEAVGGQKDLQPNPGLPKNPPPKIGQPPMTNSPPNAPPAGNPNTPINLQGLVRSSSHALYAKMP